MAFTFTEEQEQFRDIVSRFLAASAPITETRRLMAEDRGFDEAVWRRAADELGLPALTIPEAYGGAGFGPVELGIVMEELGRSLACLPYFSSSVLATSTLLHCAEETVKADLLPRLADGSLRAALALTEGDGRWDVNPEAMITCAEADAGGYRVSGTKRFVVDGHSADLLLVVARVADSSEVALLRVDPGADGVTRTPSATMDATRKLADIELDGAPAARIDGGADVTAPLDRALDDAIIALANEMVGGAQQLLDSSVAYAKMRVQFGRTIGSFQAIKHKCADMLLDVESAKSAAYQAAQAAAEGDPETPALACLAKAAAAETYVRTAAQTIQIHGGIGFTWENDTHLWFKRAKASEVFLGTPEYHRERLLQRWGY